MKLIALGYVRVSGTGQLDGDGFIRQSEAIRAFAKLHGLSLSLIFEERAVSGTVEGINRPEFIRLLDYVERLGPEVEPVIIIERMDRLARDLMVQECILRECRDRDIKVFSVDRGAMIDVATDSGDPTQKLIRQIMGALAEWEKSNLVLKLKVSRDRVREKTGRCEGNKPYGYYPGEKALVNFIQTMVESNLGWTAIARQLNLGGSKTRRGTAFTAAAIRTIWLNSEERRTKGGSMNLS